MRALSIGAAWSCTPRQLLYSELYIIFYWRYVRCHDIPFIRAFTLVKTFEIPAYQALGASERALLGGRANSI
jgi:hypothetical protein